MPATPLRDRLQQILSRLSSAGFDTRPLVFEPPASAAEIRALEAGLRLALPPGFREALLSVSAHVEFRWFAPDNIRFPEPFGSNFSGDLHWSCGHLRQFNANKDEWIKAVFDNPDDPYDRVWHDKLAFHEVGNGDYISLDLRPDTHGQVVYLSHDDGDGHGQVLADSFADWIERWVPLACTGGEDWQWLPFTSPSDPRIDPRSENARAWRTLLAIDTLDIGTVRICV